MSLIREVRLCSFFPGDTTVLFPWSGFSWKLKPQTSCHPQSRVSFLSLCYLMPCNFSPWILLAPYHSCLMPLVPKPERWAGRLLTSPASLFFWSVFSVFLDDLSQVFLNLLLKSAVLLRFRWSPVACLCASTHTHTHLLESFSLPTFRADKWRSSSPN